MVDHNGARTLLRKPASADPAQRDPLIAVLKRDYRIVDSATLLDVLVRRRTTNTGLAPARPVVLEKASQVSN
jgi:hypothetical protein